MLLKNFRFVRWVGHMLVYRYFKAWAHFTKQGLHPTNSILLSSLVNKVFQYHNAFFRSVASQRWTWMIKLCTFSCSMTCHQCFLAENVWSTSICRQTKYQIEQMCTFYSDVFEIYVFILFVYIIICSPFRLFGKYLTQILSDRVDCIIFKNIKLFPITKVVSIQFLTRLPISIWYATNLWPKKCPCSSVLYQQTFQKLIINFQWILLVEIA